MAAFETPVAPPSQWLVIAAGIKPCRNAHAGLAADLEPMVRVRVRGRVRGRDGSFNDVEGLTREANLISRLCHVLNEPFLVRPKIVSLQRHRNVSVIR